MKNLFSHEEIGDSSELFTLPYEMRVLFPWVAKQFAVAAQRSHDSLKPFASAEEHIRWRIENYLIPTLHDEFKKPPSESEHRLTGSTELEEDYSTTLLRFATILDIGVLASVFPEGTLSLFELNNSEYKTVRTATTLALLFNGHVPNTVDDDGICYSVNTRILFDIPLPMYVKIMSGLGMVRQSIPKAIKSIHEQFSSKRGIPGRFTDAETAIFLAGVDIVDTSVVNKLIDWAPIFDNTLARYPEYRQKCHRVLADMICNNALTRDLYFQKLIEEQNEMPVVEVEGWLDVLFYLDPQNTPEQVVEKTQWITDNLVGTRKAQTALARLRN